MRNFLLYGDFICNEGPALSQGSAAIPSRWPHLTLLSSLLGSRKRNRSVWFRLCEWSNPAPQSRCSTHHHQTFCVELRWQYGHTEVVLLVWETRPISISSSS